jgi:hypothetical protein
MIKLRSMCLLAGVLCTAGGAVAADGVKKQVIPDFATTDKTSTAERKLRLRLA